MVLHSQTHEASGIGEEGLTLEAQGRLKGTIQDQGGGPKAEENLWQPGPVSRIRRAALKTDNLFENKSPQSFNDVNFVSAGRFYATPASQCRA